ncbi:hypothetical protein [uncultured Shewanella sp.]|uniref:hypothetical protein n=1 Tax=uncultured Shewanella sp. TaxID=173975 RepID=UPI0026191698|nr:hypothetical protein [uncultured Shewanella sp.]
MPESKIVLSPAISHLSTEQIDELYQKYLIGIKNSDLIEEYGIDANPNMLIKLLPPLLRKDVTCPHCDLPMQQKRRSKSSYGHPPIECTACNHVVRGDSQTSESCRCVSCVRLRLDAQQQQELIDRALIEEEYSLESIVPIEYSALTFTDKILLLTLFRDHTDGDFNHILSLDDSARTDSLCPDNEMTAMYIMRLYSNEAIVVNPNSRKEAFCKDENFKDFDFSKVQWVPNIIIQGSERAALETVHLCIYTELREGLKEEWQEDIYELLNAIAIAEVIQYLTYKADELGVFFGAKKKAREIIDILIESFSVSQIYYFALKAVNDAHLYYTKHSNVSKKRAGNTIPGKMMSLGERALGEGWNLSSYSRVAACPRSALSKVLFDLILEDADAGFTKPIGRYWKEELLPKYFNIAPTQDIEGLNNVPSCLNCQSIEVDVQMSGTELSTFCKACGSIYDFNLNR